MTKTTEPLTLDRMRRDIAAMLHEDDLSEIGDDDNLMLLGLDSMSAMTLITRWQEAGVTVDFMDMAGATTLAGWWHIVQAAQARA